ncbi:MAG: hypothetical protein H6Q43_2607 [Deltaproteobacteria bacterium]|nr:hypothetical protein [Deltaproteobacteria bacterium]
MTHRHLIGGIGNFRMDGMQLLEFLILNKCLRIFIIEKQGVGQPDLHQRGKVAQGVFLLELPESFRRLFIFLLII